jgi:hypothetical protein
MGNSGMSRSYNWVFYADANGDLHQDITEVNTYNCDQQYHLSSTGVRDPSTGFFTNNSGVHLDFSAVYEDGNQGPPQSIITYISAEKQTNSNYLVTFSVKTKPSFSYWVELSTNSSGPWNKDQLSTIPYYFYVTNFTMQYQTTNSAMFFRIGSDCTY